MRVRLWRDEAGRESPRRDEGAQGPEQCMVKPSPPARLLPRPPLVTSAADGCCWDATAAPPGRGSGPVERAGDDAGAEAGAAHHGGLGAAPLAAHAAEAQLHLQAARRSTAQHGTARQGEARCSSSCVQRGGARRSTRFVCRPPRCAAKRSAAEAAVMSRRACALCECGGARGAPRSGSGTRQKEKERGRQVGVGVQDYGTTHPSGITA